MTSKKFEISIISNGSMCAIPVPFDPKEVFGKVRAPVKVTINGYTFRSTIARMGGQTFIPLRRRNREAAAVAEGDSVTVRIAADAEERTVELPDDLAKALKADETIWRNWQARSYTQRRESVEAVLGAKKPETRDRRIAKILDSVSG